MLSNLHANTKPHRKSFLMINGQAYLAKDVKKFLILAYWLAVAYFSFSTSRAGSIPYPYGLAYLAT
jgi:hypothetical protein